MTTRKKSSKRGSKKMILRDDTCEFSDRQIKQFTVLVSFVSKKITEVVLAEADKNKGRDMAYAKLLSAAIAYAGTIVSDSITDATQLHAAISYSAIDWLAQMVSSSHPDLAKKQDLSDLA